MKTGADHIHSLHDGRQVYLDGQLVDDVVEHPAYRELAWYLGTRDAHGLYAKFGFVPADPGRTMTRSRVDR